MHFPVIKIPNVADTAVEYFEELILSGVLTPGLVLPSERKLAETLDISRTSLRTAYNKLEAKGLIERKGSGVQVRGVFDVLISQPLNSLFYVDKEELFEMWKVLFRASISTACARRTAQDLSILNEFLGGLKHPEDGVNANFVSQLISRYFEAISASTYNFLLHQVLNIVNQTLSGAFHEMAEEATRNKDKKELLERYLSNITQAVERSDGEKAFSEMSQFCSWLEQCNLNQPPGPANMNAGTKVESTPPSSHAMAKLSKLLTASSLKVGDILPSTEELSQKLNITPASTRDALAKLEALGVIEIGKKDQVVIHSLVINDTRDPLLDVLVNNQRYLEAVIEFRVILEEQTSYLAAERCTPALLPKLRKRLDLLDEKFNSQDQQDYAHHDIDFHKAIASLSGNGGLRVITSALVNFFETATARWLGVYRDLTGNFSLIHEQHIAIFKAIEAGKPEKAMRAMNEHLSYVIEMTRSFNDKEHREDIALLRESLRQSDPQKTILQSA